MQRRRRRPQRKGEGGEGEDHRRQREGEAVVWVHWMEEVEEEDHRRQREGGAEVVLKRKQGVEVGVWAATAEEEVAAVRQREVKTEGGGVWAETPQGVEEE